MWLCSMHPRRQASNTSTIAGSLRKHLKTHTGEKPNKWNQCVYAICILRARQFEEIFVNAKWEKSNKCNQCDFVPSWADVLRTHFKIHSEKKSNKCNQYDYASSDASNFGKYLKAEWRKAKQMQTMHLCIISITRFEDAFEKLTRCVGNIMNNLQH